MTDLLPCPFCGGQPQYDGEDGDLRGVWVCCLNIPCPSEPKVRASTKTKAIAAWNTRTDLIQPMIDKAVAEALERAVQVLLDSRDLTFKDVLVAVDRIRAMMPVKDTP